MTIYDVSIETSADGACMAHVPGLPGCLAVGADRSRALASLPDEICGYMEGLIGHGEVWRLPEDIKLEVVEDRAERGPFHPDDRAALFDHDRRPLNRDEVERYLTLAEYNRIDLLALVRGLSDAVMDWQADPAAMSIRRILYHIGRADLWYISRLSNAVEEVPDWNNLPARRFLVLSRAAAIQRFRGLGDDDLAAVSYPPNSSDDAEAADPEGWTARKALRRFLEHEREHTAHIKEVLAEWRQELLARMAAARSLFVWQLLTLDEETLAGKPLFAAEAEGDEAAGGWTAKDVLAHVAAWDELYAKRTSLVGQGSAEEIETVDLEERNARLAEERRDWTLDVAVGAQTAARDDYLVALGGIGDADLQRRFRLPWGQRTTLATWAHWRYRHDDRHTKDMLTWLAQARPRPAVGPKSILQAALETGRQEMLATAALVPAAERGTRPLCGVWTLKDVLGHVADWEWYGVEKLGGGSSRRSLDIRFRGKIQDWNEAHAAARKDQPWDEVWADFQGARLAMGQALEGLSQDELASPFAVPWSRKWTAYRWIHLWLHHERGHAADLRLNLELTRWPMRLKRFS